MYESNPSRDLSLVVIGIYIGVAGYIAWRSYQSNRTEEWLHRSHLETRISRLENPEPDPDGAEEK